LLVKKKVGPFHSPGPDWSRSSRVGKDVNYDDNDDSHAPNKTETLSTTIPGSTRINMTWWRVLLLLSAAAGIAVGLPAASVEGVPAAAQATDTGRGLQQHTRNAIQNSDDLMDSIYSDCLRKDSVSCVKYKLFSFVDKVLGSKDSFTLTEGVTVVKTAGSPPEVSGDGAPRAISEDEDGVNKDFESMIINRVERFLKTHTLKVDLKGNEVLNAVTSAGRALGDVADSLGLSEEEEDDGKQDDLSEERGKKKKVKMLLPLLLALKLKAAALIPLFLGAIALIAGKALLIGKIALVISAIIGLKKLLSHQKTVTYEIVSHPHHTSSHHESYSSGGGGGASFGGDVGGYGGSGSGGHDLMGA
ncbi:hypothetical protein C0J52_17069, partial [Blattella germanica]